MPEQSTSSQIGNPSFHPGSVYSFGSNAHLIEVISIFYDDRRPCKDGQPITGIDIENAIEDPTFAELYNEDAVGLCCLGILQLVLLGAENRRNVPEWLLRIANDRVAWNKYPWGSYVWPTLYSQLRNATVRRWGPLYVDQPTNEDDRTTYSIFGYTWAFKTWILESFRVNAIRYFDRFNRYPRVAAWRKKKGRFTSEMVFGFFQGNIPVARLTPDDIEARSDWWISSKAYFDGFIQFNTANFTALNCIFYCITM
ncbi:hypothetical protein Tco_0343190 [Tanacetum coccineum]